MFVFLNMICLAPLFKKISELGLGLLL